MSQTSVIERLRSSYAARGGSDDRRLVGPAGDLRFRAVHEWLGPGDGASWVPALCLLADVARRGVAAGARVVWIGRRCWPSPLVFDRWREVLASAAFVDPPDRGAKVWCIDVAVRCPCATLVIADGGGLSLAETRRLQLAAAAGFGLCVLARPLSDRGELSAAATRRVFEIEAGEGRGPRWAVTLVRDKERPASMEETPRVVEWDHGQGAVGVSPVVGDRAAFACAS